MLKPSDLYYNARIAESGLLEYIQSRGADPAKLLRQAGINLVALTDNSHVTTWGAMCNLFEICARTFDESNFGLVWSRNAPLDNRGSGSTLLQLSLSKNLREFGEIATRYQSLQNAGVDYKITDNDAAKETIGIVTVHPLSPPCRQICEHLMGNIAFIGYRYVKDYQLKRVSFQFDEPENVREFQEVFRCPLEFNAPRSTIVLDHKLMGAKKDNLATKLLSPFLDAYFSREITKKQTSRLAITMMSYHVIPSILGLNSSSQEQVAKILKLHPKKYQRLLRDEGTSYAEILDDVRKNMAKRLLRDSNILIENIGGMLDYTAPTSFARASTRWFGMSPRAYRKYLREDANRIRRGGEP